MEQQVREENVELEVVAKAEMAGWLVRKVQWIGRRGAPDRVFIKDGRLVLIEFKRPGKEPIGQQRREFNRIKAAYPETYWTDDVAEALDILGIAHG